MNTSDYAGKVAKVVSDLTGIGEAEIMGKGRAAEVVDARWMVVKLVREAGYYPSQIAQVMGMTVRQVQAIITSFDMRLRFSDSLVRINYESAANHLRSN